MKFHLNYQPNKAKFDISHKSNLTFIGSCFSENISNLLKNDGFNIYSNPFGITYNPISIFEQLNLLNETQLFTRDFFIENNGMFYSYFSHSCIYEKSEEKLIETLNNLKSTFIEKLHQTDYLFITLGSAYYYTLNNKVVANCHKQPNTNFEKYIFKLSDSEFINNVIQALVKVNPKIKLIFTVSPVIHIKDGIEENYLSKSTLRLLIEQICSEFNQCFYFPAYELVNADLRDYRFYKEDLAHPNQMAIEYIYSKFKYCYFNEETIKISNEINNFSKLCSHKILNKKLEKQHDEKIIETKRMLQSKYPFITL
ncbi:MAG: GSCFA domain-containing protein [Bacteroidetes bacterium]|nr:GSCFA domain-containing protein [Bacteroidota bacterium]